MTRPQAPRNAIKAAFCAGLMIALTTSPVSATTLSVDTSGAVTSAPGSSQAHVDKQSAKAERQAAKQARKLAKKCAKWSRKAASARSVKARGKFSAMYAARCVRATTASRTVLDSPVPDSAESDELHSTDSIASVAGPQVIAGVFGKSSSSIGDSVGAYDNDATPPIDLRAVDDPVPDQVPEPGTLALLGLGLVGMWILRRKAFSA